MNKIKNKTAKYLLILIPALVLIPKNMNILFEFIPIRLAMLLLLFLIFIIEKKGKIKFTKNFYIFSLIYAFFMFGLILSIFESHDVWLTLYTLVKFLVYYLVIMSIYFTEFTKEDKKNFFKALLFSAIIIFLYGIITYIFNINLNINGAYKYGVKGRIFCTFANPIYYGLFCNLIIILVLKLKTNCINKIESLIYYLILILGIINILLTFTRSAYLVLLGVLFLFYFFEIINKRFIITLKKTWLLIVIFIFAVFNINGAYKTYYSSAYALLPTEIFNIISDFENKLYEIFTKKELKSINDKSDSENNNDQSDKKGNVKSDSESEIIDDPNTNVEYFDYENDISLETRYYYKNYAKNIAMDNLINGIGLGTYEKYANNNQLLRKYQPDLNFLIKLGAKEFGYPHNFYLHILVETGLIGLFFTMTLLIYVFVLILKENIKNKENYIPIILFISCILIGFYESVFYDIQITPLIIIAAFFLINKNDEKKFDYEINKKNFYTISAIFIIITSLFYLVNNYLKKQEEQVPVLLYHHFLEENDKEQFDNNSSYSVKVSSFLEQMKYLQEEGYKSLTLDELYCWKINKCKIPDKSFVITIDDGLVSVLKYAMPILKQYDFSATSFIITSRANEKTEDFNPFTYHYIGLDVIKEKDKTLYYGSHSHNLHEMINGKQKIYSLTKEELEKDAKKTYEILNTPYYAYPFNTYTNQQIEILRNNGFKMAFRGQSRMTNKSEDLMLTSRIVVNDDFENFKSIFTTDEYKKNKKEKINKYLKNLINKRN